MAFELHGSMYENSFKYKIRKYENSIRFGIPDIQFIYII
jgi:hypothetical protein